MSKSPCPSVSNSSPQTTSPGSKNGNKSYPTLVIDSGAYTIKAGFSTDSKPRLIPNCISKSKNERRRPFIGDQIEDCRDTSGIYFILPYQKGYLSKPDIQKAIWDYIFGRECLNVTPSETNLLITEPYFNFKSLQEVTCELLFEEYEFNSICRTTSAHLVDYKYAVENQEHSLCTLIVDAGYSFVHIIPFVNGQKVTHAIRRIDIGGKALTNHLKEVISYRQLHVLDESYLMNQVKEDVCYVSSDFNGDMKLARQKYPLNNVLREYVLPDYSNIRRGYVRTIKDIGTKPVENEQILRMNNERFTIPELLFHPSDVGVSQMGISEAITDVINGFPETMKPHFLSNIVLCGGCCKFPGFKDRVYSDVRKDSPTLYDVKVTLPDNPVTYAWEGGTKFGRDAEFSKYLVTKSTYSEIGISAFSKICDI